MPIWQEQGSDCLEQAQLPAVVAASAAEEQPIVMAAASASGSAAGSAMSLLEADETPTKRNRKLQKQDTDVETQRSCYDNFVKKFGYSWQQIDCESVQGQTIRSKVRSAVKLNHMDKKKHPLGKHVYQKILKRHPKHGPADHLSLPAVAPEVLVNDKLLDAISACAATMHKKHMVMNAIDEMGAPTAADFNELAKFITRLKPQAPGQLDDARSLVQFFADHKVRENHAELSQQLEKYIDVILFAGASEKKTIK